MIFIPGKTEKYTSPTQTPELYISNNCCGANFYQKKHIAYNNPFVWLIVPYDSMARLMRNFYSINWANITLVPSQIRENTFILVVDNQIELHYMHHFFDPNCSEPKFFRDPYGSHLGYDKVWEYIVDKYMSRVKTMCSICSVPKFIIHDQEWGHNTFSINDLVGVDTPFKRVFITEEKITNNYNTNLTKIISAKRTLADAAINNFYQSIDAFFKD